MQLNRQDFRNAIVGAALIGIVGSALRANAEVFFDLAMYGDQELRVRTVDTRWVILQDLSLAISASFIIIIFIIIFCIIAIEKFNSILMQIHI